MLGRHMSRCLSESAALVLLAGPEDPAYIKYQAESPDEAALVAAGKAFGFFFHRRNHTSVLVREPRGDAEVECEYEILNILEFDSTRKRMSVICRNSEGNIMLYCKVWCSASYAPGFCCTLPVTCPANFLLAYQAGSYAECWLSLTAPEAAESAPTWICLCEWGISADFTAMQGADTVIYERLDPANPLNGKLKQLTRDHMEAYGEAGLRTLCLACVELDPEAYDA